MAGINSQELEWQHATLSLLTTTITGLRGFKYKKNRDAEHLHAAGNEAVGIQRGNIKIDGSIKILKSELDRLNDAAQSASYADISDIPPQLIVLTFNYKVAFGRKQRTDVLYGIQFTEIERAMEQGAKQMDIELPFLATRMKSS